MRMSQSALGSMTSAEDTCWFTILFVGQQHTSQTSWRLTFSILGGATSPVPALLAVGPILVCFRTASWHQHM